MYLLPVWKVSISRISLKKAAIISGLALFINVVYLLVRKYTDQLPIVDILEENYPISLLSGLGQAYAFMQKNNLNQSKDFRFNAIKKDTLTERQVYVLIIGESQRYDRWEINGYEKSTSPQ